MNLASKDCSYSCMLDIGDFNTQMFVEDLVSAFGSGQEVCFGPSRPDSGAGWDQDRPGWPPPRDLDGSETLVEQNTWRIWTGPLRTQDGTWTGPGSDTNEGLHGTPRDSNRLLGLSEAWSLKLT